MPQINHDSEFALRCNQARKDQRNWSSDQFFVYLGELTPDRHSTVSHVVFELLQGSANSMRSLKEDHRPTCRLQGFEPVFAVFRPNWWKPKKQKGIRRKPGCHERCERGTRSRNRLDSSARLDSRANQPGAGV